MASHPIELDVIERLRGCDISEYNGRFQDLVIERIHATGLHVDALTVGQVCAIVEECRREFNKPEPPPLLDVHETKALMKQERKKYFQDDSGHI